MLAFSCFAVYEMGLFDLAVAVMVLIPICIETELRASIRLCAFTYYLTVLYKIWITYDSLLTIPADSWIRITFHFVLILVGGAFS